MWFWTLHGLQKQSMHTVLYAVMHKAVGSLFCVFIGGRVYISSFCTFQYLVFMHNFYKNRITLYILLCDLHFFISQLIRHLPHGVSIHYHFQCLPKFHLHINLIISIERFLDCFQCFADISCNVRTFMYIHHVQD